MKVQNKHNKSANEPKDDGYSDSDKADNSVVLGVKNGDVRISEYAVFGHEF